jgi:hypothetical protein
MPGLIRVTQERPNELPTPAVELRYPPWEFERPVDTLDLVLVRVNRSFPVNGKPNFIRSIHAGSFPALVGVSVNCYGFGNDTPTMRWGWFQGSSYNDQGFYLVPAHSLFVEPYGPPFHSELEMGDSGGPCFSSSGGLVGTVSTANIGYGGGGRVVAADAYVREWIVQNAR